MGKRVRSTRRSLNGYRITTFTSPLFGFLGNNSRRGGEGKMGGVRKRGMNTRNLKGLQRIDASACGHRAGVACAGTGFLS